MIKIAINDCYGGFGLSPEAALELYRRNPESELIRLHPVDEYFKPYPGEAVNRAQKKKDEAIQKWLAYLNDPTPAPETSLFMQVFTSDLRHVITTEDRTHRDHPELIDLIEEWGSQRTSGPCASLKIVEIPDHMADRWEIAEYDGNEHVAEKHQTWS